jgi:hypothetical protein
VWDEIDFEFLGNVTGQPWILQTNVYINGKADREHRTYLWFDPTTTFHTYSLLWTPNQIMSGAQSIQPFHMHCTVAFCIASPQVSLAESRGRADFDEC